MHTARTASLTGWRTAWSLLATCEFVMTQGTRSRPPDSAGLPTLLILWRPLHSPLHPLVRCRRLRDETDQLISIGTDRTSELSTSTAPINKTRICHLLRTLSYKQAHLTHHPEERGQPKTMARSRMARRLARPSTASVSSPASRRMAAPAAWYVAPVYPAHEYADPFRVKRKAERLEPERWPSLAP